MGSAIGAGLAFTGVLNQLTILSIILSLLVAFLGYQMLHNSAISESVAFLKREELQRQGSIVTQRQWYEELIAELAKAERVVLITSHEPRLARTSGLSSKRIAWEQIQTLSKTTNIIFKWLVAVDDADKLDWVEEVIDDLADRDNVSVAVVLLGESRVSPLSVQIIDRSIVLIIDPRRGYHSLMDDDRDLVCRHGEVVQFFREYYDAYWDKATLVKEGRRLYKDRLSTLRKSC